MTATLYETFGAVVIGLVGSESRAGSTKSTHSDYAGNRQYQIRLNPPDVLSLEAQTQVLIICDGISTVRRIVASFTDESLLRPPSGARPTRPALVALRPYANDAAGGRVVPPFARAVHRHPTDADAGAGTLAGRSADTTAPTATTPPPLPVEPDQPGHVVQQSNQQSPADTGAGCVRPRCAQLRVARR